MGQVSRFSRSLTTALNFAALNSPALNSAALSRIALSSTQSHSAKPSDLKNDLGESTFKTTHGKLSARLPGPFAKRASRGCTRCVRDEF